MLKLDSIYKIFNRSTINENVVFQGLSLDINDGDFITIIGGNGAGKSTLLNVISGSIPIESGKIILNDRDITNLEEYKRANYIGRIFQNPSLNVSPSLTILENISLSLNKGKSFDLKPCIDKKKIEKIKSDLSEFNLGLENFLNVKVKLLSGGQRQALSLYMVCLRVPDIFLLDEHTAALDPKTSEKIMDLTEKIVEEKKLTTIMITHNLKQAINYGNRLIMMDKGKIILDIIGDEKKKLTASKLLEMFNTKSSEILNDELIFS